MKAAHRKAHARIWTFLAIILPVAVLGLMMLRPLGPVEPTAEPLDEAAKMFLESTLED